MLVAVDLAGSLSDLLTMDREDGGRWKARGVWKEPTINECATAGSGVFGFQEECHVTAHLGARGSGSNPASR